MRNCFLFRFLGLNNQQFASAQLPELACGHEASISEGDEEAVLPFSRLAGDPEKPGCGTLDERGADYPGHWQNHEHATGF